MEEHDVAIVVLMRGKGVDYRDAVHRAENAVQFALTNAMKFDEDNTRPNLIDVRSGERMRVFRVQNVNAALTAGDLRLATRADLGDQR